MSERMKQKEMNKLSCGNLVLRGNNLSKYLMSNLARHKIKENNQMVNEFLLILNTFSLLSQRIDRIKT